ncbi:guanitoxin biosynthesis L-arginine gamma (S) hydroxylase [Bordetella genomosp. 1]|uniref:Fatty acid desaturase n=1 Tax=Bordetella genomosp. 1 TaxID=1395607 RepID=A0ABX4EYU1_9BORD|nr:guanitoxin biosynthesis L-arginine gamma (S) hydroxylase [Bordetella genomosp. 1]OZI64248.1 fatty acid desaturase [Bordetella genomosp. 1]
MKKHEFSKEIKAQVRKLYIYDNHHGATAVAVNFFYVCLAIYLSQTFIWTYPLSIIIIGARQRALATILHEASHGVLCRNKSLEKFLGAWASGYLIFQSWESYKNSHVHNHHNYLGDPNLDPDYIFFRESGVFDKQTRRSFVIEHFIRPMLFLSSASSMRYLIINRLIKSKNRKEAVYILCTQMIVAFAMGTVAGMRGYFIFWLLPYATTFQTLTWFIELSEHYPMVATADSNLTATRNRFSHAIEHFLTGMHGENYHLVHHLFPGIPHWHLKKAHEILMQDKRYAKVNSAFGGIFLSNNSKPSMWSRILFENRHTP